MMNRPSFLPGLKLLLAALAGLLLTPAFEITGLAEEQSPLGWTESNRSPVAACSEANETTEGLFQGVDSDRGCCLWKSSEGNKCSYTNRGYCRTKAEELKVQYEFHKDKTCQTVDGCPAVTPP